ncbi:MAG: esterase-like activity of phytase family protein [Gammaproteobacteria bacterium]
MSRFCRVLWGTFLIAASLALSTTQAVFGQSSSTRLSARFDAGDRFEDIRLLGTVRLHAVKLQGHRLASLSALAWDEDEQILYAVSDKGVLFHLKLGFQNGMLDSARALAAYPLTDSKQQALSYPWADAEGLAVRRAANGKRR